MAKPGKWIKTLLFGKKSSKSNLSKGRDSLKSVNEKEAGDSAQAPIADLDVSPPIFSQPVPNAADRNGRNSELEKGVASNLSQDGMVARPGKQDEDIQGNMQIVAAHDPERIRQEQVATKIQAAFRGYLARRAFRALRGIIRLQALVRGHLVRRQAAATLRCLQGIVKFQALVRGRSVRISNLGNGVHEKCNIRNVLEGGKHCSSFGVGSSTRREKLWANAFISKHLASSPNVMPLHLQYGRGESNSAWSWLELWTISRIWEPLPQPKKVDPKSQTRPKRSVRKVPAATLDNGSIRSSSESEKPKRYLRKALSHPVDPVHESPQNEIEKIKRNLKKVSNSTIEITDRIEAESEKPKHIPRKASGSPAPDVPDLGIVALSEKTEKEMAAPVPKHLDAEIPSVTLTAVETVEELRDGHPAVDSSNVESFDKDENVPATNGELISKEVKSGNENQKASRRRASFPAKQEYSENGLQNSPKLPSYMAATESAKAKLRAQGTVKSDIDTAEQNGLTRRHSLPSSTNGKLSSPSPRTQKVAQASGKGGVKADRSFLASRDGNEKAVQAEWRR